MRKISVKRPMVALMASVMCMLILGTSAAASGVEDAISPMVFIPGV